MSLTRFFSKPNRVPLLLMAGNIATHSAVQVYFKKSPKNSGNEPAKDTSGAATVNMTRK